MGKYVQFRNKMEFDLKRWRKDKSKSKWNQNCIFGKHFSRSFFLKFSHSVRFQSYPYLQLCTLIFDRECIGRRSHKYALLHKTPLRLHWKPIQKHKYCYFGQNVTPQWHFGSYQLSSIVHWFLENAETFSN